MITARARQIPNEFRVERIISVRIRRPWFVTIPPTGVRGRRRPFVSALLPASCCRTRRRSAPTGRSTIGGCRVDDIAARVRHAAVRLRRGAPARPLPRGGRRVRRTAASSTRPRRSSAGRWPGSRTRRDAARRRQRRRAARRARRRRAGGGVRVPRQQQEPRRAAHGARRGRAPHRRRQLRRARPPRRAPRDGRRAAPDVLLRITPGVHAHTHEFIATGQDDSKFGFNLANGDAAAGGRPGRGGRRRCNLVGLHCHIGSNVFAAESFGQGGRGDGRVRRAARPARAGPRRRARRRLRRGRGGADDHRVGDGRARRLPAARRARRGERRARPGDRRRGGDHGVHGRHGQGDPRRPHLRRRRRRHERQPAARCCTAAATRRSCPGPVGAERPQRVRVVGKHCESGDVLLFDARCPPTSRSATCSPRRSPAPTATRWARTTTRCRARRWCSSRDGEARLVVRRETYEDLLAATAIDRAVDVAPTLTRCPDGWMDPVGRLQPHHGDVPARRAQRRAHDRPQAADRPPGRAGRAHRVHARSSTATPIRARSSGLGAVRGGSRRRARTARSSIIGRRGDDAVGRPADDASATTATAGRGRHRGRGIRSGRPSYAKVDRLLDIDPDDGAPRRRDRSTALGSTRSSGRRPALRRRPLTNRPGSAASGTS